jgi:HD-GYP domain-containing protein (c-di-GMP phosphodiesterase class II)
VASASRIVCRELELGPTQSAVVSFAALFHDIGKTAVSERIIQKEGILTGEEFEAVKLHTEKTRQILDRIDWPEPFAKVPDLAACHHERWDGSGYPFGLTGDRIPVGSRVIAVVDYFDALTVRRRYREPLPFPAACVQLEKRSGSLFDPAVAGAFLRRLAGRRPPAAFASRSAAALAAGSFTRTGTFVAPPRFAEDPRPCRGIEWPRCR